MPELQSPVCELNRLLKNEEYKLPFSVLFALDPVVKFILNEQEFCVPIKDFKLDGVNESVGLAYGVNMMNEIGSLEFLQKLLEIPHFKENVPDDVDYKWLENNFLYKPVDVELQR